jgi:hypothetical protein
MVFFSLLSSSGMAGTLEDKLSALSQFKKSTKVITLDYNPFATQDVLEKLSHTDSAIEEAQKGPILLSVLNDKAFISGKWYKVGEMMDGGRIEAIFPTYVRIKKGTQVQTLSFEKSKRLLHVKDIKQ